MSLAERISKCISKLAVTCYLNLYLICFVKLLDRELTVANLRYEIVRGRGVS